MAKKNSHKPLNASKVTPRQQATSNCYEGERLDDLLAKIRRSIELAKVSKTEQLPEKIWIKQHFAIGVNDVTRVLERMPQLEMEYHYAKEQIDSHLHRAPLVPLQAVLLVSDCIPRSLTKHIPSLASSRQVQVILVKDNKRGSLRLGGLLKLKTTLAIGVKVTGSSINTIVDELLAERGNKKKE